MSLESLWSPVPGTDLQEQLQVGVLASLTSVTKDVESLAQALKGNFLT